MRRTLYQSVIRVIRLNLCNSFTEFYSMAYRKFRADQLFDGFQLLDDQQVLVTDDNGVVQEIVPFEQAGDNVKKFDGILSPGFINCHCHLELSHMKGLISEHTGLVKFVLTIVQQRHFPEEEILQAIEKAEDEMLRNGIVATGDICNNTLTLTQKTKGRLYYHNFIETSGFNPTIARERFERSAGFFKLYGSNYSIPVESNSIVPHAPYSVAHELWEMIVNFPGNHLLTIHNQETIGEDEWFRVKQGEFSDLYKQLNIDSSFFKSTGKSSLQSYLPKFLRNQSVIMVHNVYTSEEDILFSQSPSVNCQLTWCFCPNANQYITGKLPDIDLFIKHSCDIVLGTDSLASNHHLSILEEMKTIKKHFPHIEIKEMLKWATSNGAKALEMDQLLGSFEKGKRPGIVLIDPSIQNLQRLA